MCSDASAAIGMAHRQCLGKKLSTNNNPADLLTNALNSESNEVHGGDGVRSRQQSSQHCSDAKEELSGRTAEQ